MNHKDKIMKLRVLSLLTDFHKEISFPSVPNIFTLPGNEPKGHLRNLQVKISSLSWIFNLKMYSIKYNIRKVRISNILEIIFSFLWMHFFKFYLFSCTVNAHWNFPHLHSSLFILTLTSVSPQIPSYSSSHQQRTGSSELSTEHGTRRRNKTRQKTSHQGCARQPSRHKGSHPEQAKELETPLALL